MRAVIYLIIFLSMLFVVVVGATRMAPAHEWYPSACCSGQDCKAVPQEDLEEQADGTWVHLPTGTVFTKDTVHPSQDNKWHVCMYDTAIYDDSGSSKPGEYYVGRCVFIQNSM